MVIAVTSIPCQTLTMRFWQLTTKPLLKLSLNKPARHAHPPRVKTPANDSNAAEREQMGKVGR